MTEREIFAAALALDTPSQREAYLREVCGEDRNLQQRIETLLRDEQALGNFLESPPPGLGATAAATIPERTGEAIGPYKLLQKLGEGGMGVVYMAEQREPVVRRVALKIIKPGMDTQQVIARFEAERQALAMMDHQHIARVLDAGQTDSGSPYFVMELVKGVPITEYCDHNKLTPRERLELLLPVCHAIQHAHQKGIIHRDIKPSNIMVTLYDGKPVPKIIDFGVAKATAQRLTEKTMFTMYGQLVGTLEYMSPEQAEMSALDIDTRSDIYSLGVLLYELLTGSTPLSMNQLRQVSLAEMLRLIREQEPERPSTRLSHSGEALPAISAQRRTDPKRLSALMLNELDWIVLKALEKDRSRRYESASSLARDLERYLADEPVEACPPSTWYRLRKQLGKHRPLVATTAVVVASLLVGMAASLAMYWQANQARLQANASRQAEAVTSAQLRQTLQSLDEALLAKMSALQSQQATLAEKEGALLKSEASRLIAQSSAELRENPGLALLLAVQSTRLGTPRTAAQNAALLAALAECREVQTLPARMPGEKTSALGFEITSAQYGHDGSYIVVLAERSEPRVHYRGTVRMNFRVTVGLAQVYRADGSLIATIQAPPDQTYAAAEVSPDGRYLVGRFGSSVLVEHGASTEKEEWRSCLYSDRVARVWDLQTGKEVQVLRGHTQPVTAARFSPEGNRILTSSWDGTLRVWDTTSGEQLRLIEPGGHAIDDAHFSPQGQRLLAVFPGAFREIQYADQDGGRGKVDEIDPPLDGRRVIADTRTGETGRAHRQFGLTAQVQANLPANLSFLDTGVAGVRLWDADSFEEIPLQLQPGADEEALQVANLVFARNPARAILATAKGVIYSVALSDGKQLARWESGLDNVKSIALSDDQQQLVAVSPEGAMAVQQLASGETLRAWDSSSWKAQSACFGSSGELLYVVHGLADTADLDGPEGRVAILDLASGKRRGWLKGHTGKVNSLLLSPAAEHVLTGSADGTARLWQADLSDNVAAVLPGFGPVRQALFSPSSKQVLVLASGPKGSQHWQGFGLLYDVATGQRSRVLADEKYKANSNWMQHGIGGVFQAQFSDDGKRILTVSNDHHVRLIDPQTTGAELFNLPQDQWPVAETLPYTPVRIWDAETGREQFALEGLTLAVSWASFTPDGQQIITLCRRWSEHTNLQTVAGETKVLGRHSGLDHDQSVPQLHVWDAQTGRLLFTARDLLNPTHDLSDGGTVPLAINPKNGWVVITELCGAIDFQAGKSYSLPGIWSSSTPLFSPEGRYLLTYTQREATVLDLENLKSGKGRNGGEMEIRRFEDQGKSSVSKIPMPLSRTYQRVRVGEHADTITSACFSADSRSFATASADRTVRIWNTATGQLQQVLRGHPGPVRQAEFSPDGKYFATISSDHVIRLFQVASGREFVVLRGHRAKIHSISFSSDGQTLLSASADGTIRLWPVDPLPVAISRLPRELTKAEATQYEIEPTLREEQDRSSSSQHE